MIWQDFKELNFIPLNEDARIYLSYWTLERALILYPLKNVEIVQIYAWVWRICVNIQMTAISSPNHAMFYILSASQLLCKFQQFQQIRDSCKTCTHRSDHACLTRHNKR